MRSRRIITLTGLSRPSRQTTEWMARARTRKTKAEILRWSRWETVSACLLLIGVIGAFIVPLVGVGLAVWHARHGEAPWLWWLGGSIGAASLLLTAGAWLGSYASDRRLTALYADGHSTIGHVDEVIVHPGGGDDPTTYELVVTADLAGGVRLHRTLDWGADATGGNAPQRWVGRSVRIRHNTLNPDEVRDVRFDGWAGGEQVRR